MALVGVASTSQASTEEPGSAFGLAANGPVDIKPMPLVVSPGAETARKSLLEQPANSMIITKALSVASNDKQSEARAAEVRTVQEEISAGAISARCQDGRGVSQLTKAMVAGRQIESNPAPNTTVPVTIDKVGTATVTFNKQVRRADGRLAVTGMAVNVPLPEGKTQTIDVAKVTCAPVYGQSSSTDGEFGEGAIEGSGPVDGGTDATDSTGTAIDRATDGSAEAGPTDGDISAAVRENKITKPAPAPVPAEVNLPVAG
jgi:hypothetical protein